MEGRESRVKSTKKLKASLQQISVGGCRGRKFDAEGKGGFEIKGTKTKTERGKLCLAGKGGMSGKGLKQKNVEIQRKGSRRQVSNVCSR